MVSSDRQDCYLEGYEKYGYSIERIGKTKHQSCLLLTSRTKPPEIVGIEGEKQSIRTLPVNGLASEDAKQILH